MKGRGSKTDVSAWRPRKLKVGLKQMIYLEYTKIIFKFTSVRLRAAGKLVGHSTTGISNQYSLVAI
jgi:hypothetical protein